MDVTAPTVYCICVVVIHLCVYVSSQVRAPVYSSGPAPHWPRATDVAAGDWMLLERGDILASSSLVLYFTSE